MARLNISFGNAPVTQRRVPLIACLWPLSFLKHHSTKDIAQVTALGATEVALANHAAMLMYFSISPSCRQQKNSRRSCGRASMVSPMMLSQLSSLSPR